MAAIDRAATIEANLRDATHSPWRRDHSAPQHAARGRRGLVTAVVVPFERWRPVVTHPGLYEVSNLGRVRSCERLDAIGRHRAGRLLAPWINGHGYRHVTVSVDGRQETMKVAKLVAMAFCGPRPSLEHDVLHGDGQKTNDRAGNLRWGTARENAADAKRHGAVRCGEQHGRSKLSTADVASIRQDLRPTGQVARDFGIAARTVRDVRSCRTWRHLPLAAAA